MARSTKEGQYYLIPLMVVSMPLMTLPVLPSVELDLGNSLIPLTGVVLLLRSLIEGEYLVAIKYFLPVAAVTALACWMSIRWAVSQFHDEDVLFREGEQFHLGWWLVHLVRDRQATPGVAGAFLAATLMLVVRFFAMFVIAPPVNWTHFVWIALASQMMVVAPVVILALLLTRSLKRTFLFQWAAPTTVLLATGLAVAIHPLATTVNVWLHAIYPVSEQARAQMAELERPWSTRPVF
jgi:sodium transport system permease protein